MDLNLPECSHVCNVPDQQPIEEHVKKEVSTISTQYDETSSAKTPKSFSLIASSQEPEKENNKQKVQGPMSLIIKPSYQTPIMHQPRSRIDLQSPMRSLVIQGQQPLSLFLQALNKFETSLGFTELAQLNTQKNENQTIISNQLGDISPPDSLTNAPPSYSFVLRQMAARRRPRLMGTFIPSPSFVQHTPPPTYATAFDIYVDNQMAPPPQQRVYNFGFSSRPTICPECGFAGMTLTTPKVTLCTHLCAFLLCLFCCWLCAPLPYILRSCKDVYHHCQNCRTYLGVYCPTNPQAQL